MRVEPSHAGQNPLREITTTERWEDQAVSDLSNPGRRACPRQRGPELDACQAIIGRDERRGESVDPAALGRRAIAFSISEA